MSVTTQDALPLLIDLYELVMAQGYLESEMASWEGVFHAFYRRLPHHCHVVVSAGQPLVCDWLQQVQFRSEHLEYLGSLQRADGTPLFKAWFLERLRTLQWELTIDGVEEGTLMLPHVPMMRVHGPLWQAQLVESALLNQLNFSSLVATYAAHLQRVAQDKPILEFGLRRAQGPNGAISASRAAVLGGCAATSNVAAGFLYDLPVFGTMAHSWVMALGDEQKAFDLMADLYPEGTILLLDTFDHRSGTQHAIQTALRLKQKGKSLRGVRLDSGDLHQETVHVRAELDRAGLQDLQIVISSDLDLLKVRQLVELGTPCQAFGVGTALATAVHDPHLTGVYKLGAVRSSPTSPWTACVKQSDDPQKASKGWILEPYRCRNAEGMWVSDQIDRVASWPTVSQRPQVEQGVRCEPLFHRWMERGQLVREEIAVAAVRQQVMASMRAWTEAPAVRGR